MLWVLIAVFHIFRILRAESKGVGDSWLSMRLEAGGWAEKVIFLTAFPFLRCKQRIPNKVYGFQKNSHFHDNAAKQRFSRFGW